MELLAYTYGAAPIHTLQHLYLSRIGHLRISACLTAGCHAPTASFSGLRKPAGGVGIGSGGGGRGGGGPGREIGSNSRDLAARVEAAAPAPGRPHSTDPAVGGSCSEGGVCGAAVPQQGGQPAAPDPAPGRAAAEEHLQQSQLSRGQPGELLPLTAPVAIPGRGPGGGRSQGALPHRAASAPSLLCTSPTNSRKVNASASCQLAPSAAGPANPTAQSKALCSQMKSALIRVGCTRGLVICLVT